MILLPLLLRASASTKLPVPTFGLYRAGAGAPLLTLFSPSSHPQIVLFSPCSHPQTATGRRRRPSSRPKTPHFHPQITISALKNDLLPLKSSLLPSSTPLRSAGERSASGQIANFNLLTIPILHQAKRHEHIRDHTVPNRFKAITFFARVIDSYVDSIDPSG